MQILADYHTHTKYSHGKGTIEENVLEAISKGIKTIGISDHGYKHLAYGIKLNDIYKMREEIDKLNEILNPQNFVKHKKEIENKYKYLKVFDEKEKLEKLKLNFQKIFLKIMKKEISKAETKQDIEKIIYDFRYYMMIPYDNNILVQGKEELQKNIKETSELIIAKANELKTIEKISNDKATNDEILKNIFKVRIIKLEDAYLKITKEKEKYFVQIFDENIFEEKIEISKPKDLEIKLNKKIPIWIH